MKRDSIVKLAALFILIPIARAGQPSTDNVQRGEKVKVDGAHTQPCYADSCANRVLLTVTLPPGAKYAGTHYFTTADYPNDRGDVYETGPSEVSYARFSQAVHAPNGNGQEVVTVYYYNRSNRTRWVQISVDYD